jgi:hypothetical protein
MLTAYFDESFESSDGWAVIAGFLGYKEQWVQCAKEWKIALHPRTSLHMKKLRWIRNRNADLLLRMAKVPHECGLLPVFAAVRVSDYIDQVGDYEAKKLTTGYFVALYCAVLAVLDYLPKGERVELIFEEQVDYAAVREFALHDIAKKKSLRKAKKTALAKWSSIPKSSLLEPADYLAYALMQTLVDPHSLRSKLCSPILNRGKKRIGGKLSKHEVNKLLHFKKDLPL